MQLTWSGINFINYLKVIKLYSVNTKRKKFVCWVTAIKVSLTNIGSSSFFDE